MSDLFFNSYIRTRNAAGVSGLALPCRSAPSD